MTYLRTEMTNTSSSRIGSLILAIALIAVVAILIMMFGARMGLWEPIVGFGYVRNFMNPIAYAVLALGVIGLIYQIVTRNSAGIAKTAIASFIGLCLITPTIYAVVKPTKRAPPIHDITTNTEAPPAFLVLDETRSGAKNSLVYGGPKVAGMQKKFYPHIKPIQSNLSAPAAFDKALAIAEDKGWEIVSQDPIALRFEATARTVVYSFMDDVVVVVTPQESASRVDMRSVSRIGRSDKGVNAARIDDFISTFNQ